MPDRGELRAELLEFLELLSARATGIAAAFTLLTSEYFSKANATPNDLSAALMQGDAQPLTAILKRAVARGEIDRKRLTPPITSLLSDLFRHHAIMNFAPPPVALRKAWVDTIFLPLVQPK